MTITVGDASALNITAEVTLECWAKLEPNTKNVHALVSKDGAYGMAVGKGDETYPGFVGKIGDGTNYTFTVEDPQVWIDDSWHHFAFTFKDNTRARLWVDGNKVFEDTSVSTSLSTSTADLLMGELTANSWTINGVLDDVRLWSVERTKTEIQDNRFLDLTGNETNLNGLWSLSEGSGTTINDETANDNHGTLNEGEWVARTTDNTDYFRSPTGQADVGLSKPTPCTVTNTDNFTADDGTVVSFMEVSVPSLNRKAKYQRLLYREQGANQWQVVEDLDNLNNTVSVTINGLSPNVTYEVATRSYSSVSTEYLTVTATNSPFTTDPKTQNPANVQNLTATIQASSVLLEWDSVPDKDVKYYAIRRRKDGSGTSWSNATKEPPSANTEQRVSPPAGSWEFMVKAVDTSGNESDTAAVANGASEDYLPSGTIILWSGSISNIPAGFTLCDGSNGTPDLTDRFVVGAGSGYSVGGTGGSVDGDHWITNNSDRHLMGNEDSTSVYPYSIKDDNRPPYYALAYIMKT